MVVGANNRDLGPVCNLLTDDAGLGPELSISWIEEGIRQTSLVLEGKLVSADWDREHWGSTISSSITEVYWMYSDECPDEFRATLGTPEFHRLLTAWKDFISSPRGDAVDIHIER